MSGIFRKRFDPQRYLQPPVILTKTPSASVEVIPGTASLTLTTFAPTVATPRNVTPGIATLTLTTFAPTVATPRNVTPGTASLTLTSFAPTVTTTAHVNVTPGTASLVLTLFAPTVAAGGNKEVIPGTASLTLTTFAPTVDAGASVEVTPGTASLTITRYAPTVEVSIDDVDVVIFGGDDAPPKKRKRRKERHELFRELEATIHALLHPAPEVEEDAPIPAPLEAGTARQLVDELVVLAEGQHQLIQRAAALRAELAQLETARREQEEEDEFLMFM